MNLFAGRLIDWWRRRQGNSPRIDKVRTYSTVATMPAQLDRHVLALAGEPATWAVMECPCGHGHRLQIRIRRHESSAVWRIDETDDGPSLFPSVDFASPTRRCHFWLDRGRVKWVKDRDVRSSG